MYLYPPLVQKLAAAVAAENDEEKKKRSRSRSFALHFHVFPAARAHVRRARSDYPDARTRLIHNAANSISHKTPDIPSRLFFHLIKSQGGIIEKLSLFALPSFWAPKNSILHSLAHHSTCLIRQIAQRRRKRKNKFNTEFLCQLLLMMWFWVIYCHF